MWNPAKRSFSLFARKACALLLTYCFFATSLWSATGSGAEQAGRRPAEWTTLTGAGLGDIERALSQEHPIARRNINAAAKVAGLAKENVSSNFAALKTPVMPLAMMQAGSGISSISSNFNATSIPAGDTIWFSAVLKLNGAVPNVPVSIAVHGSTIQFTAGGTNYSLNVPDAVVTFSPTVSASTATFDTANNPQPVWLQNQLNPQPSGNTLLQAFAFPVPAGGLPGGIKNVTWTGHFSSDTSNITLNWQWAAAVYTGCVKSTYNSDDVKPADDSVSSVYKNSDHAGTPEACKNFVTQGATGGGASNYTGSLSGTASVTPPVVAVAPVITSAVTPQPNGSGWNNTNVTVSFSCSDVNFAIAKCPSPVTVASEGAGQVITGTAIDQAGGAAASSSITVNLDKSSPSITASANSSSGGGSVLTLPVTVTFNCADAVSGVASCPAPIQVTSAGAHQVFSGTATDKAGNTATTSIALSTENAPLAITRLISPAPVNSWNNTDVQISYQCTGGVPPVQCPQSTTVTAEGAGQIISATATDAAGQSSTLTTTLNIDKTVPVISATVTPAPNTAGWNTGDVTITYTCSDALSGIAVCPPQQVVSTEGKAQQISASVSDQAGNTANAGTIINLEKTAPHILASVAPAPNAAGWNNSDVTVSFICTPSVSDIVSCPGAVPVTEDKTQEISGTVSDQAGKSNTATVTVKVDKTLPSIQITTPVAGSYLNNNHFPISVSFSDAGSGIDATTLHLSIDGVDHTAEFTSTNTGASGSLTSALADGTHAVTASISDNAGNVATATASFVVDTVPPQITITQPVDGIFTNAVSVVVSGSIVDASPVTVTVEGATIPLQGNTFTSAAITLGANGPQVLHVTATDAAGNSSAAAITLKIDRTPPLISGSVTPVPNAAGWNNTAVTVTFTCSDADSGIATCPAPVPVDIEGADQSILGTAVDKAGNTAQAAVKVSIDKTAPVITATPAPAPNAAGWNITDVTLSYACSDSLSGVVACPAPQVVNAEGKAEPITATISDKAGNTATSTVILNIEKTAPTIAALLSPSPNAAGWNKTDVTVSFNCTPSVSDIVTCQPPVTVTNEGKAQNIPGSVTDQAGKTASTSAIVNIDKTAPLISASAAPAPNGAGWNNTDVVISYVCSDSLSGIAVCPPPAQVSAEGANEIVTGQATDQAGNTGVATSTLNIDKTPPTITATSAPPANGAGWNNTNVTVNFSCADNLSGVASCPSTTQVSSEGQNQPVPGQAVDVAGNVATGSITVSIDKTAPSIVQISAPDHISRLHGGQIDVTVNDNFTVTQVVISLNGTALTTSASAPYQAPLQVPAGSNPGDTLTISVQATDEAGNVQTASRGVRVAADGVVVGQVLSDTTSFPVQGATVQAIAKTSLADQTDPRGRYSLQVSDSHLFVNVSSPGTTSVEREVFVQEGVGTVPVDARLTSLSAPVPVGSAGGTIKSGNIVLSVPAGIVMDGTSMQLTSLSGQGLPGLLPLGWSPLAAFDVRASSSAANISASITQLPNVISHLVIYDPSLHAWTMATPNIQAVNGSASVTLPAPGAYALVVPDVVDPPVTIPNTGNALTGIDMQVLSPSSASSGSLSPAILPPSGGTATATLGVQSPAFVPSGTVIQANVSEKFSLKSGDVVSEENRSEDIVLYNAIAPTGSSLGAKFPVVPSRKFANAELLTGKVHLDILAGREGVRGQPGGSNPLVLNDGVTTLSVPGGALSEDTAISIQSITFEDFIPVSSSFGPLQEVVVDFSGETLNTPAQLSISATGLNPAHSFLLTKVERIDGIPRIVAVALAQINGANLTSVASPGLPGVTEGGEYVFYELSAPSGFIQGIISTSVGPVQALVQTDSLPLVSITGADGRYILPALSGSANVKASVPHTNLLGTASVQVNAGQTTPLNITLSGTVTNAVVSPADGALGVPVSTVITVTTTSPLNLQSIQQGNLVLLKGTASAGTPVALQPFVLSTSGTVLSFAPQKNLDPATQYTIQVSGLADNFGGAIVVPSSSFTTKAVAPINFDPNALTFSFPDANGIIHVSAPAGSLPPGTRVLIVDQTSAYVLSVTAFNDGSVSGDFPGTINDVLQVTVTDPNGATTTFTRSQFVAADGSVAVGAGGGTVTGDGGVELRIPAGAVDRAVTMKIEAFGPDLFADRPNLPGANFGAGLKVTSQDKPTFKQEVKLAFPKPADAPDGSFFYVYRRLETPSGTPIYETLDEAFVEGSGADAKVVTASPPFLGNVDSIASYRIAPDGTIGVDSAIITYNVLMFSIDLAFPLLATTGLVTGEVKRPKFGTTQGSTVEFEPIVGAVVTFADANGNPQPERGIATTGADGRYTLFNPFYRDGTIKLTTAVNGVKQVATAYEFLPTDVTVFQWYTKLSRTYKTVAQANFTFAPLQPPPPAPDIAIHTFTGDTNQRKEVFGVVIANTPLTIGFKSNTTSQLQLSDRPNATIQQGGTSQPVQLTLAPDTDQSSHRTDLIASFAPGLPGSYTVTFTLLPPLGGAPITVTHSFLVIADAGGGNNVLIPNVAPDVITGLLVPKDKQKGVSTQIFPQVVFTQPVLDVYNNLRLIDGTGSFVDMKVSAVGVDATGSSFAIDDLSQASLNTAITSVTMQPTGGLQFGMTYQISLGGQIHNTDASNPQYLTPRSYSFTTFTPATLSDVGSFDSPGMFVADDRVYLAGRDFSTSGRVHVYDISDPVDPQEIAQGFFPGLAIHIDGEKNSPVAGNSTLIAVGETSFFDGGPSNLWLYKDVTPANQQGINTAGLERIGAVSVTGSTEEGTILRVAIKGTFAYALTFPKGIQVIDLNAVTQDWANAINGNGFTQTQMFRGLSVPGEGWATDAIVNTIPLPGPGGVGFMQMSSIKADDFLLDDGSSQTLVLATGRLPLLIANPQTGARLYDSPSLPPSFLGTLTSGWAMALGKVADPQTPGNDRQVAVIVGYGTAPSNPFYTSSQPSLSGGSVMAIIDVTKPESPQPMGFYLLPASATDVVVNGTKAYVATSSQTIVIDFSNPAKPMKSGAIPGLGGRLGAADPNLVLSTSLNGQPGLHIAQLDQLRCSMLSGKGLSSSPAVPVQGKFGWTLNAHVDPKLGFAVSDVLLGDRYMAKSLTLPSIELHTGDATTGTGNLGRCQLKIDGSTACENSPTSRSRLTKVTTTPIPLNNGFALEATFVIDRLFGDPEAIQDPQAPEACVVLTQRYEFYKEGAKACEASGELGCAVWNPLVSYKYLRDVDAPKLASITPVQRMEFNPTPKGVTPPVEEHPTLFHDCEFISPVLAQIATTMMQQGKLQAAQDLVNAYKAGKLVPDNFTMSDPNFAEFQNCVRGNPQPGRQLHITNTYRQQNPLTSEVNLNIVQSGQAASLPDNNGETVDNIHLTYSPSVSEPRFNPGCPECVHIHWRWASFLKPGFPHVSPSFQGGGGAPIIPPGSNQDVSIALTEKKQGDEDPQVNFSQLGTGGAPLSHPVFWYAGTGHKPTDSFFTHGGFFATLWPEKFTYDSNSGLITFHVQHTPGHTITWKAKNTIGPADVPPASLDILPDPTPASGTLDASDTGVFFLTLDLISLLTPVPFPFNLILDAAAGTADKFTFVTVEVTDTATGAVTSASYRIINGQLVDPLP